MTRTNEPMYTTSAMMMYRMAVAVTMSFGTPASRTMIIVMAREPVHASMPNQMRPAMPLITTGMCVPRNPKVVRSCTG